MPGGINFLSGGVLRGDGLVSTGTLPVSLPPGAELRVADGERLALQSGDLSNAGRIRVLGTGFNPAEIQLEGNVTNVAGTGTVLAHHATLCFRQGLDNNGSVTFGSGLNDVLGDISNNPGGAILVTGGATAIFADDVSNASVINVSASASLSSTAVFFGALSGNGVSGAGDVFIEGDARPGFSPGTMSFGGNLTFGPLALTEIEIAGTGPVTLVPADDGRVRVEIQRDLTSLPREFFRLKVSIQP